VLCTNRLTAVLLFLHLMSIYIAEKPARHIRKQAVFLDEKFDETCSTIPIVLQNKLVKW